MKTPEFRALKPGTICTYKQPNRKTLWVVVWYVIPSGVVFRLPDTSTIEVPNANADYVEDMERETRDDQRAAGLGSFHGATNSAHSARG